MTMLNAEKNWREALEASISNVPIHTGNTFTHTGNTYWHQEGTQSSRFQMPLRCHVCTKEQTDTLFTTLAHNSVQKVVTVSRQHAFKMKCLYSLTWKSEFHS